MPALPAPSRDLRSIPLIPQNYALSKAVSWGSWMVCIIAGCTKTCLNEKSPIWRVLPVLASAVLVVQVIQVAWSMLKRRKHEPSNASQFSSLSSGGYFALKADPLTQAKSALKAAEEKMRKVTEKLKESTEKLDKQNNDYAEQNELLVKTQAKFTKTQEEYQKLLVLQQTNITEETERKAIQMSELTKIIESQQRVAKATEQQIQHLEKEVTRLKETSQDLDQSIQEHKETVKELQSLAKEEKTVLSTIRAQILEHTSTLPRLTADLAAATNKRGLTVRPKGQD